jgi:uncharacterized cupin superfamily protein
MDVSQELDQTGRLKGRRVGNHASKSTAVESHRGSGDFVASFPAQRVEAALRLDRPCATATNWRNREMTRQNLFSGDWEDADVAGTRYRMFWRPEGARMGSTLWELAPGSNLGRLHMHFGAEEMFFVLAGRPVFRNQRGEEQLEPGDFVSCPEGRAGLHTFSNPSGEPARLLAISAGSFPDVVAYPEQGYAWVATRDPDPDLLARGGDPGIIARFEIPIE